MDTKLALQQVNRENVVGSYDNAVHWSVDTFFRTLLPRIPYESTFLLYTSDHGQSIKEGASLATHGVVENPPSVQANVPLFAWGHYATKRFHSPKLSLDRYSQFQVFPTVVQVFGYDAAEIQDMYGPALWEGASSSRRFISGDVFGRGQPRMNEFDLTRELR
jgi:glucan phosphoethanolaminetransferase (alkaline phosphatase superfamily)